jgi:hypothetical protein
MDYWMAFYTERLRKKNMLALGGLGQEQLTFGVQSLTVPKLTP